MALFHKKSDMIGADNALPGRAVAMRVSPLHAVTGARIVPPFPEGLSEAQFALGCFWGAERLFWTLPGVYSTAVGYAGGFTPNPTYEEVCSGLTGHSEVVRVIFDPTRIRLDDLLKAFWEAHDPTQVMRQGNDVGSQYRSAIYYLDAAQRQQVQVSERAFQQRLTAARYGKITTEIAAAREFYYAEDYHQQYLHKNPGGYCGLAGTGVSCPIGTGVAAPGH